MATDLQAENQALRQRLDAILREARANELKMQRFEQVEHRLISARSMSDLVNLLLDEYRNAFAIDAVSLILVDHDQEVSRILGSERAEDARMQALTLVPTSAPIKALYGDALRPCLGPYRAVEHQHLFVGAKVPLASVALLPLVRHGELIGSFHFGSSDPARYEHHAGTRFLERLVAVISVCLESALNQERLKQAGLTDALTGVHNRRYFEHRCQIEISQARRYRHPLACMFLDIDHFKSINDGYGHGTGDEVLRTVGKLILGQLRAGDTIARYGGEEFVALLPRASAEHACEIAERIRSKIAATPMAALSGEALRVTISIGLSVLDAEPGDTPQGPVAEHLVASADEALYEAKRRGRNQVVWEFEPAPVKLPVLTDVKPH